MEETPINSTRMHSGLSKWFMDSDGRKHINSKRFTMGVHMNWLSTCIIYVVYLFCSGIINLYCLGLLQMFICIVSVVYTCTVHMLFGVGYGKVSRTDIRGKRKRGRQIEVERHVSTRHANYWTESGRGDGQGDVGSEDHQTYR